MENLEELSPRSARDAVGFVVVMQQLKERSGLTYRELEERAAHNGDVLARSTLADVLRRTSLPRPDVLAAFVRACGDGQRVGIWLEARDRIAADTAVAAATDHQGEVEGVTPPRSAEPPDTRPRRPRVRTVVLAAGLMVPLLALAAWVLLPEGSDDPGAPGTSTAASRAPADGWVTVRPVRTPDLCLTDGRDRGGAYASAVAVQLPCAEVPVPRTYLEPVGAGFYRIQWHHPQEGRGCLTVIASGPVKGMLEPRNNCAGATLFRVAAASADESEGFRLRPAHSGKCIGMSGDDITEGAEAVEERCTGAADQRFLVRTD